MRSPASSTMIIVADVPTSGSRRMREVSAPKLPKVSRTKSPKPSLPTLPMMATSPPSLSKEMPVLAAQPPMPMPISSTRESLPRSGQSLTGFPQTSATRIPRQTTSAIANHLERIWVGHRGGSTSMFGNPPLSQRACETGRLLDAGTAVLYSQLCSHKLPGVCTRRVSVCPHCASASPSPLSSR